MDFPLEALTDSDLKHTSKRIPWNKGKSIGQKKPFTPEQVRLIKDLLKTEKSGRDLALFSVAIDTLLRASDLVKLKVDDVCDSQRGVKEEFQVRQKKTDKGLTVTLNKETRAAVQAWVIEAGKMPWDHLFTGLPKSKMPNKAISTTQFWRLLKKWAIMIRLNPTAYACHSTRRTKAALAWQVTGGNVEIVRRMLGQKDVTSTSHYLGVTDQEALDVAKRINI